MVQRMGGTRRKTRNKLKKPMDRKGKISIRAYYKSFAVDDRVVFKADSSVHKGLYHPNIHGRSGKIVGKRGSCYIVSYKDGSKIKKTIVHPVHIKKLS